MIMSFASYLIEMMNSANESTIDMVGFPLDESGFVDEADQFGVDKLEAPSKEGLDAAQSAADQFAVASDGKDTDVNLSSHDSFPEKSNIGKDANSEIKPEEVKVDVNTVPSYPEEKDQFSDPVTDDKVEDANMSAEELASEEDMKDDTHLEESFTGWDDLFV